MDDTYYFDTIEQAIAAMPGCDVVLTTANGWDARKELVGKFTPAKKIHGNYHGIETEQYWMNNESGWVVAKETIDKINSMMSK